MFIDVDAFMTFTNPVVSKLKRAGYCINNIFSQRLINSKLSKTLLVDYYRNILIIFAFIVLTSERP
jgi:hypothetical protein